MSVYVLRHSDINMEKLLWKKESTRRQPSGFVSTLSLLCDDVMFHLCFTLSFLHHHFMLVFIDDESLINN